MQNKIIKEVRFYNIKNENDIFSLKFDKGVNIIIGSKGGGKSTLLNIIHSIHNIMQPNKDCLKVFSEYGFKIKELVYSNDEILGFLNLNKYSKDKNSDLIKQDDFIKTKLNEDQEIEKDKKEFISSILQDNINYISSMFEKYFQTFVNLFEVKNKGINWSILLKNFNTNESLVNKYQKQISSICENNLSFESNLEKYTSLLALNNVYQFLFKQLDEKSYFKYKKYLNKMNVEHNNIINDKLKKHTTSNTFKKSLNSLEEKIKKSTDKNQNIILIKNNVKKMFTDISNTLSTNCAYFEYFYSGKIKFNLKAEKQSKYNMILSIDKTIELKHSSDDSESWTKEIMDKFLYTTSQKRTHWANWIKKSNNEERPLKKNIDIHESFKIINELLYEKVQEFVQLNADGKDYNTMSLGSRTSYGLNQKIKNFNSPIIFLDQPEDNLDNYTIYNDLLSLINDNKIDQVFLVTHNSNLGALSKPKTITTCNLTKNNFEKSYFQNNSLIEKIQINEIIHDNPVLHYLEGGKDSLIKREYELIKKGNNYEQ